jgi:ATP synthase protein I
VSDEDSAGKDSAIARFARFGAIGLGVAFEFVGGIAAGVFIGYQLDAYLGTGPWLLILMTLAGTAIGFYRMIQILRRFQLRT